MMTIDLDVVLMIEKIVTTNQEEMGISNLEDVLTIKKMAITNQDAVLRMINQEDVLIIEKMVNTNLDADLTMIVNQSVFQMINQIADMENRHTRISDMN